MHIDARTASQELLIDWYRRARQNQHIHYACANFFSRLNYVIGIPAFSLSFAVGTAVFAYIEHDATSTGKIILGLVSVLAGILGILHTLLGFAERSEKHRTTSARYGSARRRLELLNVTVDLPMESLRAQLAEITRELDAIAAVSPEVPERIKRSTIASLARREPPGHRGAIPGDNVGGPEGQT